MKRRILLAAAVAVFVLGAASASASTPLALDQPLGIDVAPNGSLLVVEVVRRLVRVAPSTGRVTEIATLVKPWGVARASTGSIYVSDGGKLRRVDPGHAPVTVATVGPAFEIGPVAVARNGDIVYATAYALYRLRGGKGTPTQIAPGTVFNSAHGIAATADGSLLVAASAARGRSRTRVPRPGAPSCARRHRERHSAPAARRARGRRDPSRRRVPRGSSPSAPGGSRPGRRGGSAARSKGSGSTRARRGETALRRDSRRTIVLDHVRERVAARPLRPRGEQRRASTVRAHLARPGRSQLTNVDAARCRPASGPPTPTHPA